MFLHLWLLKRPVMKKPRKITQLLPKWCFLSKVLIFKKFFGSTRLIRIVVSTPAVCSARMSWCKPPSYPGCGRITWPVDNQWQSSHPQLLLGHLSHRCLFSHLHAQDHRNALFNGAFSWHDLGFAALQQESSLTLRIFPGAEKVKDPLVVSFGLPTNPGCQSQMKVYRGSLIHIDSNMDSCNPGGVLSCWDPSFRKAEQKENQKRHFHHRSI